MDAALTIPAPVQLKRLNPFERYLSVWVALCIMVGVGLGQTFPQLVQSLRSAEFGEGSHINLPIAVLIWLMIVPMMMKVDLTALRQAQERRCIGSLMIPLLPLLKPH